MYFAIFNTGQSSRQTCSSLSTRGMLL
ncbi:hypothetical protein CIB84_008387 [Bambusicola thoracicus]|uniref:Uncharacterized protein n=1 Tax=Bambusicola thoracicus TaxID=9083 RepID=A0A2P4SUS2_BAMTH|nr:hypothetical protein CIB84_008387 [Bambusicola thoracicus]